MSRSVDLREAEWRGPTVPYDLVKEIVAAFVVILLLTAALAAIFESPDAKPVTIRSWSQTDPVDFLTTAVSELDGSSDTAGYGHPYNNTPDSAQHIGFFKPQQWLPATHKIDPPEDFVLGPLDRSGNNTYASLADSYRAAPSDQQTRWLKSYKEALGKATVSGDQLQLPAGDYGPVAPLLGAELNLARSGALDTALMSTPQFYNTNYTKALLFLGDGSYFSDLAQKEHLTGDQWGMMNETGNYPGQAWLWLYTFWYQISPFNNSSNADLEIWVIMIVLTLALIAVPFLPVIRSIPRWIPLHRVIWRRPVRGEGPP